MTEPLSEALARVSGTPRESLDVTHATPELFAALAAAQAKMSTVAKGGHNEFAHYDYATADSMIAGARAAREGTGLALLSTWSSADADDHGGDGGEWVCAIVTLHWVLSHAGGGYLRGTITSHAIGSKRRPPDKAVAAAATYAEGFLERGLMRIDRGAGDKTDVDQRDDTEYERPRAKTQPKRSQKAPKSPPKTKTEVPDTEAALARIRRHVGQLMETGAWDDAAGDRALVKLRALGSDEGLLRQWLTELREGLDRGAREDAAIGRATGTIDTTCLGALEIASSAPELLAACRAGRGALLALPRAVLSAALLKHAERLDVDVNALDAALEEAPR